MEGVPFMTSATNRVIQVSRLLGALREAGFAPVAEDAGLQVDALSGRVSFTRAALPAEIDSLRVIVGRLRAKLGEEHANLIQTVRSVGYRFGQSRWGV